jgi:RNA polymerase sigma-70 factor (ECF subfamily)
MANAALARSETVVTETALLERVARGDHTAVKKCIQAYGGLVWSLAQRFIDNPADAEEAVQDVFLELWASAERYDAQRSGEVTFVAMIARRRLIDRQRRERQRQAGDQRLAARTAPESSGNGGTSEARDPNPGPNASLERSEETRRVLDALHTLGREQREVIHLYSWRGLSHAAIAAHTGLPLGTVKSHLRRGFERIRQLLGQREAAGSLS